MTPTEPITAEVTVWPLPQLIAVRWLAVLLALQAPFLIWALFPYTASAGEWVTGRFDRPIMWFGETVLRFDSVPSQQTGSGDRAIDWSRNALFTLLAAIGTALWTARARARRNEQAVLDGIYVALRYGLGLTLILYGLVKVLPSQFSQPQGDDLLLTTYGESSPMGLLWRYMGFSRTFQFFAGAVEVLGGGLLLFRRTWLVGALVSAAAMTQVVVINFAFDVPVKIFSSQLLAAAIVLILPFRHRLVSALLSDRAIEAHPTRHANLPLRLQRLKTPVKAALLLICIGFTTNQAWDSHNQRTFEIAGIYRVDNATTTHRTSSTTVVSINHFRTMSMWQTVGDRSTGEWFSVELDGDVLTVSGFNGERGEFTITRPSSATLVLDGELDGLPASFTLKERPAELLSRGFHWVSEEPYSR